MRTMISVVLRRRGSERALEAPSTCLTCTPSRVDRPQAACCCNGPAGVAALLSPKGTSPDLGSSGRKRPASVTALLCVAAAFCVALVFAGLRPASASAEIVHPFVSSFGSFSYVEGVAVDQSTEDVYVYDASAKKIYKYTASGTPAEFSFTKTDAISGVSGAFPPEAELAVDSSSSEAKGDIYLVHGGEEGVEIFDEAGELVGALTEEAGVPWGETCGVAVDAAGAVYVGIYNGEIDKYVPKGSVVTNADYTESIGVKSNPCNLATDAARNVFGAIYEGPVERWAASQFGTTNATGTLVDATGDTLAVDPANSELYVDEESQVSQYGVHGEPFEEPVATFAYAGPGAIKNSLGIAVNGKTHQVYIANSTHVSIFGAGVHTPTVTTGGPTSVEEHAVVVTGTVNPEGNALTTCKFEYEEAESYLATGVYGQSIPCAETVGAIGSGSAPVAVHAQLTGLMRATRYDYRLVVANVGGEYHGGAEHVETAGPPVILEPHVIQDTSGEATIAATINPRYLPTTYRLEYGTSESYGEVSAEPELPEADGSGHSVSLTMSGLQPSTAYHFRIVATNSSGETVGADNVLSTFAPTTSTLPDGRGYEQVTPEVKHGTEAYQPVVQVGDFYQVEFRRAWESNTETEFTFQAAADGNGLAYVEGPTVGGNESQGFGVGNEYLATRLANGGWSQKLLSPEGAHSSVFEAFTPDLGTAFLCSRHPLSPNAPGYREENARGNSYDTLYKVSTAGGAYEPFFSTKPPYRTVEVFGTAIGTARTPTGPLPESSCGHYGLAFEGASEDDTHLLFAADDALTGASEGRPAAEGGLSYYTYGRENNLYESVDGQLRLVNVLPDGTTHRNATFGGTEEAYPEDRLFFNHVISADGSRIFWTDLDNGHIYMREDGVRTIEISPHGMYQTATSNGSTVFYINGDLYAYDVESGETTDLTPGISVHQVVGASEDGEYIYYTTSGNELAVWHAGVSTQITSKPIILNPAASITAEATPNGDSIAFELEEEKIYPKDGRNYVDRVEVYDAETDELYCASCTSLGAFGYLQMSNDENVYQPRWISADGSRVFFVSVEGLVPQDTNEEQDVYEWERDGTGGCKQNDGCVYILTGGTSIGQSSFLDASESGEDVFVVTRANLDGSDEDGAFDIYDARVGAKAPIVPSACSGSGCQGVPAAPPIFASPPTVTFNGIGNLAARQMKAHSKKHGRRKAKRGLRRRLRSTVRLCRRENRHNQHKRSTCERAARHRYAAQSARRHSRRVAGKRHRNGRGK